MTRSLRCIVSLVMLAAVLIPATASAQAEDEPFRRGISARNDRARGDARWAAVIEAMRQAIAANRMESTRKVGGRGIFGGGTEYLPYYFMGEAFKNLGDCGSAVTTWETSQEQKVVLGLQQYATELLAGLKDCQTKGVLLREDFAKQVALTDQVYRDTFELSSKLDKVKEANQDVWRPEVQAEVDRARNDLVQAQKALVKGRQSRFLADFSESRTLATRAGNVLRPLEARLGAAISTRTALKEQSAAIQQVLNGADTNDRAIDAAKVALPPNLTTARESARAVIRTARERLGQAEKTESTATAGEALRLANEGSEAIGKVLEQVKKLERGDFELRLQQLVAGATEQISFVGNSIAALERLVAAKPGTMTPEMTSQRDAVVKENGSLQRRFENARRTENVNGIQDVMRLAIEARARIDALIKAFGPVTLKDRGVETALEEGARHYLAGEYQQALSSLEPLANRTDIPLQVHLHVFRAASLYALYMHSGEKDQTLRTNALAEVQRSKEIDAAFKPDPRAFTPRFLSFFETGGSGSQAPPPSQ